MAAFVDSKEAGERIVKMFKTGAFLDYRDYEPNWIQVKVGACFSQAPNLQALQFFTQSGTITQDMVNESSGESSWYNIAE